MSVIKKILAEALLLLKRDSGAAATSSTHRGAATALSADIAPSESIQKTKAVRVIRWEDLPGPMRLPGIGTAYKFISKRNRQNLHHVTEELVEQYGKVIRLGLGPKRTFAVGCASLMEEIIRREDPVPRREEPEPWREYIKLHKDSTGGLLTSQGEEWERKRRAVRALMLKPLSMEHMVDSLAEITDDLCNYLASRRDDTNYVDQLPAQLYKWSFEGIVSVVFGMRAGCLETKPNKRGEDFISAVSVILDGCFNTLMINPSIQRKLNTKAWRQHEQAWDTAMESTRYFTDKMLAKEPNAATPIALSLLTNTKLSNSDIEYTLLEFLFGGVDTTSNSLGFALHLLASHPEKQEKLRTEIGDVLQSGTKIDLASIQKMKYLGCCIKETLRLYPILFVNGRTIQSDFTSKDGIQFQASDMVMFFHYYMSRDSDVWKNGDQFIPERFDRSTSSADSAERQLVAIPFGFGTRGCIGKRIAELELSLGLIKIITRFNLTVDSRFPFEPVTRAVLTPGKQIPVKFSERRSSL